MKTAIEESIDRVLAGVAPSQTADDLVESGLPFLPLTDLLMLLGITGGVLLTYVVGAAIPKVLKGVHKFFKWVYHKSGLSREKARQAHQVEKKVAALVGVVKLWRDRLSAARGDQAIAVYQQWEPLYKKLNAEFEDTTKYCLKLATSPNNTDRDRKVFDAVCKAVQTTYESFQHTNKALLKGMERLMDERTKMAATGQKLSKLRGNQMLVYAMELAGFRL